uniref:Uncharacterized protein n=1 Tax=Panagrolaimus sp. PS1159 TaxID=55785 RepID=A0AC35GXS7_9BILA
MSQLRPLFGEDYVNACGFNEETVQLEKGYSSISFPSQVERRLTSSAALLEDANDVKGLCKALHITEKEMLTLQLNGLKNFGTLVKFIRDNVTTKTLVCSLYIITHELETKDSNPTEKHIKQISKILLGHHILMCIPVEKIFHTGIIETIIMKGTELTPEVLQHFQREAIAIFDYDEIHRKPGVDIIKDSQMYVFGETKALFVQLAEDPLCNETSAVEIGLYVILIAAGIALFSMAFRRGKK